VSKLLAGTIYPASRPSIKGSQYPVKHGSGRISSPFSPAVILGSSIVRNVTVPGAKTLSYPRARVNDIAKLLLNVQHQDMEIDFFHSPCGF
jgi:hypothetical protein